VMRNKYLESTDMPFLQIDWPEGVAAGFFSLISNKI